jgi:hypothetical protein
MTCRGRRCDFRHQIIVGEVDAEKSLSVCSTSSSVSTGGEPKRSANRVSLLPRLVKAMDDGPIERTDARWTTTRCMVSKAAQASMQAKGSNGPHSFARWDATAGLHF